MNKQTTLEGKAKTQNGIIRMAFAVLSILLEVLFLFIVITRLSSGYATVVEGIVHTISTILVLLIYAQHKTSSMKMPWIVLIMAVPFVGVFLYLLVGLNRGTRKMRKRFSDIDAILLPILEDKEENPQLEVELKKTDPGAAGISTYLSSRSGYPLWNNTDITYYDQAIDGLEAQLAEIKKAEKFIFMEYHAIEDKISWGRIEELLEKKAKEGVEVRVFYDDMGSIGFINTDFVQKLESKQIACQVFNPFAPGLNFFLNNRDHRKITVIDGKVGFTGGYNLADEYFNITHPYGKWKDTGIKLEGDAVNSLTVTFLEMWNAGKSNSKRAMETNFEKYLFINDNDNNHGHGSFVQPYADSPMDRERVGENVYISMVEKANKYCYFVTPYLIVTDEMTHALSLAAKRGVDVRIVTPGIPDKKIVYSVTRSFYNQLAKDGVKIYEWTPGFCHCKMSVVDDKMATCGTINLDYRSLYHNFENGCWIYDGDVAVRIKDDFMTMFNEADEVTLKYTDGRSSLLRVSQLILRFFAELM